VLVPVPGEVRRNHEETTGRKFAGSYADPARWENPRRRAFHRKRLARRPETKERARQRGWPADLCRANHSNGPTGIPAGLFAAGNAIFARFPWPGAERRESIKGQRMGAKPQARDAGRAGTGKDAVAMGAGGKSG